MCAYIYIHVSLSQSQGTHHFVCSEDVDNSVCDIRQAHLGEISAWL